VQKLKPFVSKCPSLVLGFRAIERVTGINHNSMLNWVRQAAAAVADENYELPETAQIDERLKPLLVKKNKIWLWTVVNTKFPGILKFVVGDHYCATFQLLWRVIAGWACFL
jgi:insertion element IS1 protein InsB